ncbi:hypothetical protein HPE56_15640 [Maribacter sp. ANRC-HE7]|uniref:Uncharacterized protein n=1 Tax=Maribacter aquimaris TaxID=2737171 RepID=A0ABR7V376_9FLAO|nr:hypothetical protein [Maribacter aquimaris]MBD0779233.1 hypothetical protein [Maribacter aquimaris]
MFTPIPISLILPVKLFGSTIMDLKSVQTNVKVNGGLQIKDKQKWDLIGKNPPFQFGG